MLGGASGKEPYDAASRAEIAVKSVAFVLFDGLRRSQGKDKRWMGQFLPLSLSAWCFFLG